MGSRTKIELIKFQVFHSRHRFYGGFFLRRTRQITLCKRYKKEPRCVLIDITPEHPLINQWFVWQLISSTKKSSTDQRFHYYYQYLNFIQRDAIYILKLNQIKSLSKWTQKFTCFFKVLKLLVISSFSLVKTSTLYYGLLCLWSKTHKYF